MTGNSNSNLWWPIDDSGVTRATDALTKEGLAWLDRFPNQPSILAGFEAQGSLAIGLSPAGALDIADLYAALGRGADTRRTLENYVDQPRLASHAPYLVSYLEAGGHADLVGRITTRAAYT